MAVAGDPQRMLSTGRPDASPRLYLHPDALVRLVLPEPAVAHEARLAAPAGHQRLTCELAWVESHAALARARAQGRLTAGGHEQAAERLETLWSELSPVALDAAMIRQAAKLAEHHVLDAADALHLACMLAEHAHAPLAFVCWDARLRRAAHLAGVPLRPSEA